MREHVDLDVLVNWVLMLRAEADGAVWLVDDEKEARFYERCAHRKAKIIPAPGVAIRLLDALEARGVEGLVASLRTDERVTPARHNVFRPSRGDTVLLVLLAKTCDSVITDICGAPWLLACEKQVGPIRSRAVWVARILGELRRACRGVDAPALDLDRIDELISWDVFELEWDRVRSILSASGVASGLIGPIQSAACSAPSDHDVVQCDGMDAVRVLAAATKLFRPRGIKANREVGAQDLVGMLRASFDLGELELDKVFWQMKQWEWRNQGYPLLREWRTLDSLGVVFDQRYWEADLERMMRLSGANGEIAAFKMDLDNFKKLNDALGHTAGDEAIRTYCKIVKELFRSRGQVYRRGGDEVIGLAPELGAPAALALAENIRAALESEFRRWGERHSLATSPTASIGLVLTTRPTPASVVIEILDTMELQAKRNGGNRVEYATLPDCSQGKA